MHPRAVKFSKFSGEPSPQTALGGHTIGTPYGCYCTHWSLPALLMSTAFSYQKENPGSGGVFIFLEDIIYVTVFGLFDTKRKLPMLCFQHLHKLKYQS